MVFESEECLQLIMTILQTLYEHDLGQVGENWFCKTIDYMYVVWTAAFLWDVYTQTLRN